MSRNDYDWLGDGVYFWQDAPRRAYLWAKELHTVSPVVLEATIKLADCLDFLDPDWFAFLSATYDQFVAARKKVGAPLPTQHGLAHRLDRAVINYAVEVLSEHGIIIRTVRAAFAEGLPAYPGSALFDRAHVQVAVRDLSLVTELRLTEAHNGGQE